MLTSRTHAALDLGVIAGLAGVALTPLASPGVRWAAAAAAMLQAGQVSVTDYEAGLVPLLSLERHRALDAAAAAMLGVAGLALRSPVLLAAGAATLAPAMFTAPHSHGVPSMLYRPLDVPKPFAPDVWLVDGEIGPGIPVRMTAIRLPDGTLLLHSPTRLTAGLRNALEAIGPIRHLVAPNSVHWTFVKAWQEAIPEATTYGAPGLARRGQVRRAGLRIDADLSDTPPSAWGGAFEQQIVQGGAGFREAVLLHRPSRTVLMTDLVQNFEPGKLPWVLRPIAALLGNTTAASRAPAHLRAVVALAGNAARDAARRIVAWRPDRIVVTHGHPIEHGAAERLRRSLAWLAG